MDKCSTISLVKEDGTVISTYCHWDGELRYNGVTLLIHYGDKEKVKELISLGPISSLGKKIHPIGEHSHNNPEDGVTIFYQRDGSSSEKVLLKQEVYPNLLTFMKKTTAPHNYIYKEKTKKWYYTQTLNLRIKNPFSMFGGMSSEPTDSDIDLTPLAQLIRQQHRYNSLDNEEKQDYELYVKELIIKKQHDFLQKKLKSDQDTEVDNPKKKMKI